jgi:hypothetical protein
VLLTRDSRRDLRVSNLAVANETKPPRHCHNSHPSSDGRRHSGVNLSERSEDTDQRHPSPAMQRKMLTHDQEDQESVENHGKKAADHRFR